VCIQHKSQLHAINTVVNLTSSVAAGFGRHGMPPPASNADLLPFDLETGMRVASKVGNLSSKFGHARPLRSGIIRYVRDVQTDSQTDGQKQRLLPLPCGRRHNSQVVNQTVRQMLSVCYTGWAKLNGASLHFC